MLGSLQRLKAMLDRPAHSYRPTMETFNDLDVHRIAQDLRLADRGRQRGGENQPPSQEETLDAIETEIVELVGAAQKRAQDELENQLAGFRQRLVDLDFEARFAGIKDVAYGGLADLKAEQQMGLDDLHGLRRDLTEAEKYLEDFRRDHRLNRPARITTRLGVTLKILIIVALVIAELVTNGYFLSRGDELGLIGGTVQALVFSVLNVGVALLIAVFGLPYLGHRSILARLWGLIWLAFFLAWTFALNLGLAHYREAGATQLAGAGVEVMTRLGNRPLQLDDFESWILFGLGCLFAVVALLDGASLRDPYPQFQKIADSVRLARARYAAMRRDRIQDLTDLREDYQTTVSELRADLSKRRTEHEAIMAHRTRQITLFNEHQTQLERACNALLRVYRDANGAARTTPVPPSFGQPFELKRIQVQLAREQEWSAEDLKAAISGAQADLERVMGALSELFEETLGRYRELDRLAPGT